MVCLFVTYSGTSTRLSSLAVDHKHPEVEQEMKSVIQSRQTREIDCEIVRGKWILNETGACGFRFDAVTHISVS